MARPYSTFGPTDQGPSIGGDVAKALLSSIPSSEAFRPVKHRRMNLLAILINLFVPWLDFCLICWAISFWPHYQAPILVGAAIVTSFAIVAASAYMAGRCKENSADPKWYAFFAFAMLVAVMAAMVFGEMSYELYMEQVYDLNNMNAVPDVNPANSSGQQLMDAGRLYFAEGTSLDTPKAMSFKNGDHYCVAPIVNGKDQLRSYDFWAVGINCCRGQTPDFRCGEYNNVHARAGLRVMRAEQRPFFRLAVEQAEAAYNLRAEHPMFFYWLQDPVHQMSEWSNQAFRFLLMCDMCHFVFNFFCVSCAVIVFSKMG
eukprot:TRINITY_DN65311_c0_g1_i1.p1 TRINITY_DN65311_c0_g1~~TRINITY_DN65311_c0_g1_i1.p1  ORF type:complete len:314 (-),score=61.69 TRINITY_DN65311_c0_g1_i1:63-1004(-)